MFESLQERLGSVFDGLKRRGALSESDVTAALREVRVALLEADVALPVVKDFVGQVKERAVGAEVIKSVSPGQQVVKIVNDALVDMLSGDGGGEGEGLNFAANPPVVFMMVGLQGSGKTTSTAKIAKRLQEREKKKVMMASLDVQRPAAQEQLKVLGEQSGVATLPIMPGQMPVDIASRAMNAAKLQGFDVLMLDTAGRLHVDASLMAELAAVKKASDPTEILLVADSLTGQDAVTVADSFNKQMGITGAVLTRMDGDGRGGAALSLRAVTGKPIKLIGTGEKLDELEEFHPKRIAGRILGMGDVVSLVEKASETLEAEEAEKLAKRLKKGTFDFNDMLTQFRQMKKMGGLKGLMGLMPGMGKLQKQMAGANLDESVMKRQEAIILSMTPKERANPKMIAASRKKRIAAGAGVHVSDVNKLMKAYQQMGTVMKRMKKMGKKGMLPPGLGGGMGGPMGDLPPGMEDFLPKK
ncbi:MAG: signal recognition particle protein [Pseudomonadota bacterium]